MQSRENARRDWLHSIFLQYGQSIVQRCATFYSQLAQLPRQTRRRIQVVAGSSLTGISLALAIVASGAQAPPALSSTIVVDGTVCTLPDAVMAANTNTAVGGCTTGLGDDILDLQADAVITGPLQITSTVSISGNNHTIDANGGNFRILSVSSGNLSLNQITLTGADYPNNGGGGIHADESTLTLNEATISGNIARYGGGIYGYKSDITLNDSLISGNTAELSDGGGIYMYGGDLRLSNTQVLSNTADDNAGGIHLYSYNGIPSTIEITNNSIISGNVAKDEGGGVYLYADGSDQEIEFTLENSSILNNVGEDRGGGIYAGSDDVDITIENSVVSGNQLTETLSNNGGANLVAPSASVETDGGGGIYSQGPLSISQSTIRNNVSTGGGGGIVARGDTTIDQSLIADNEAEYGGGGILFTDGTNQVVNSTISGNTSNTGNHATLATPERGSGGGVLDYDATTTIENSTIFGNSAGGAYTEGGGISAVNTDLTIERNIISGNTAANRSEVGNIDSTPSTNGAQLVAASNVTSSFNLFGHDGLTGLQAIGGFVPNLTTDYFAVSDQLTATPLANILDTTLRENGGPTQSHNLVANSPAIDRATTTDCTQAPLNGEDQRGFARPFDGDGNNSAICDLGAVEYDPSPVLDVIDDQIAIDIASDLSATFSEAIQKGSGEIRIHLASDDSVVLAIQVSDPAVSVNGSRMIIDLLDQLDPNTDYYVTMDYGAILDLNGNPFGGVADETTWSFTSGGRLVYVPMIVR